MSLFICPKILSCTYGQACRLRKKNCCCFDFQVRTGQVATMCKTQDKKNWVRNEKTGLLTLLGIAHLFREIHLPLREQSYLPGKHDAINIVLDSLGQFNL